jgi:hypothetical protein
LDLIRAVSEIFAVISIPRDTETLAALLAPFAKNRRSIPFFPHQFPRERTTESQGGAAEAGIPDVELLALAELGFL